MTEPYRIVPYDQTQAESWLECWLLTAGNSTAWLYLYRDKPVYEGESIELVAVDVEDRVVGFLDIEIEETPGSLCLRSEEPRGAFPWEFGVMKPMWGKGLGRRLVRHAERLLSGQWGIHYMEWWSMDPRSQGWYERQGMECIDTHWRFTAEKGGAAESLAVEGMDLVNAHMTCTPDAWDDAKRELNIITRPPLEPRLCRGYAHHF